MNFITLQTGEFLDCVLTSCCHIYQNGDDQRKKKIIDVIKKNIYNKDQLSNILKFTIVINFNLIYGNFNRYIYLKQDKNYHLLAIKENNGYRTYFNELYNIENILPIEVNEKIVSYSNPYEISKVSKLYNDLSERFRIIKSSENKNLDYVKNLEIDKCVNIPKKADSVISHINCDLSNIEINNLYKMKGEDTDIKYPKNVKVLYTLDYNFNFSPYKNLNELFLFMNRETIFPPNLKKIEFVMDSNTNMDIPEILEKLPKSVFDVSINILRYPYNKHFTITSDIKILKINSENEEETIDMYINILSRLKELSIVNFYNNSLEKYPKTLEKIYTETENIDLSYLNNCKELGLLVWPQQVIFPINIKILNIDQFFLKTKRDISNTNIEYININYIEDLSYLDNIKLPINFKEFVITENQYIKGKSYPKARIIKKEKTFKDIFMKEYHEIITL